MESSSVWGLTLTVDNVNEALPLALNSIRERGQPFTSRGMPTLEYPGPVRTTYRSPQRRVLFDPFRDANPFFHLMEAMWILSGSDNIALPCYFLPGVERFSDDGMHFHGAYGHRMRHWPLRVSGESEVDQLLQTVAWLSMRPDSRQSVISIWDPEKDLVASSKDVPCNDMIMLGVREGKLHMTVCNRSNDVIWGAYGANVVQFSILHEWLAVAIGVEVGYYSQLSNSFHVYVDNPYWEKFLAGEHAHGHVHNPYMNGVEPYPIAVTQDEAKLVLEDAELLNERAVQGQVLLGRGRCFQSPFFDRVIAPAIFAFMAYRAGKYGDALARLRYVDAEDWRMAMTEWVERRQANARAAKVA